MKKLQLVIILVFIVLISDVIKPQWVQTNFSEKYSADFILSYKNNLYVSAFPKLVVDTGGVFKSTDLGTSWARVSDGMQAEYYRKIIGFANGGFDYIFVATDSGVYCSTDNGDNWIEKNNEIGKASIGNIDYIDGILFTSYYLHSFRSTDLGNSWQEILFEQNHRGAGAFLKMEDYILSVMNDGSSNFLFKSIDLGLTWSSVGESGGLYQSKQMVLVGNNIYAGSGTTLFKSTDDGLNWNSVPGIPSGYYYLDLKEYNDYLFCVHQTGIYFQHKDSANWIQASSDLVPAFMMAGELDENYIYAATSDSKIWRRPISNVLTNVDHHLFIPKEFNLEQNYPNPFNPSTKISWQSPVGSWQTLKVYDVLGKEVATLVDEYKPAGSYEVEFKSTVGSRQLASGIYYYQLRSGDYVETKKMILMK
jgi:photosystem II stability/assembly factor-like uncharacterized protein